MQIIVSFYQITASFNSNVDVRWPSSVQAVWAFFGFLTMEVFKIHGYDCMFGDFDYLDRYMRSLLIYPLVARIMSGHEYIAFPLPSKL